MFAVVVVARYAVSAIRRPEGVAAQEEVALKVRLRRRQLRTEIRFSRAGVA